MSCSLEGACMRLGNQRRWREWTSCGLPQGLEADGNFSVVWVLQFYSICRGSRVSWACGSIGCEALPFDRGSGWKR
ncbi:hypothetical protein L484_016641 [Morus notabilis]|uniref:Uncharacterized protein n=1 Tax=Morus notabilis TaxID=981085 RepID=W9RLK7_9ROSA|nr:hypothetical protein L484_016641 [Morus notabilis]